MANSLESLAGTLKAAKRQDLNFKLLNRISLVSIHRFLNGTEFMNEMLYFRKGKVNYGPELLLQVNDSIGIKILE